MAEGGWLGVAIPEEYGGGGRGITEAAIVLREVARSGAAMNGCSALHLTIFGLNPVVQFGSDRLKSVPARAAAGDLHVAFGVTEPDAGTDTAASTRAEPEATAATWSTAARSGPPRRSRARSSCCWPAPGWRGAWTGLSLFLADLDPAHVDIRPIPKMGRNAVASCEVAYDGLPVPGWRLVGEEGQGGGTCCTGSTPSASCWRPRPWASARSRSTGRSPTPTSGGVRPAHRRQPGHRPPAGPGPRPARSRLDGRPARRLALRPRARLRRGGAERQVPGGRGAFFAADRAVQTLGGMGYATEYHVERYFREARLQRIAPVSQEMTLNYVAHNVLSLPCSY